MIQRSASSRLAPRAVVGDDRVVLAIYTAVLLLQMAVAVYIFWLN